MSILDQLVPGDIEHDICIVGAGPVGIALALECERLGLSVLVLEAGAEKAAWRKRAEKAEISHPNHHVPIHVATRSGFGGTSWAWSGICGKFDDIDFRAREHVPHSGWPLSHKDVAPYYDRAARLLNCPSAFPDAGPPSGLEWIDTDSIPLHSTQPKVAITHWQHFERSQKITVCLNSPVVGLDLGNDGDRVRSVIVAAPGGNFGIRTPRVVLTAGGLRTTQLLLATQRRWPRHFGGPQGALGRYYMGHLTGWISSIKLDTHADADALFYGGTKGGDQIMRRRLTIAPEKQLAERLFNIAFWPVAPLFYDPRRAQDSLSAHIALAAPKLGEWLAGGFRNAFLGPPPRRAGAHIRSILKAPVSTALGAFRVLFNNATGRPSLAVPAGEQRPCIYSLQYHAEAEPNAESRVTLADKPDRMGLPRLKIDMTFTGKDAQSVVRAHELLDGSLRKAGRGQLSYWSSPGDRERGVLAQATDGYHQMGTTRMGTDPTQSVVDRDCRVHGLANLFVASSSVFPTGSQANPTLLATALGLRLASHLAAVCRAVECVIGA